MGSVKKDHIDLVALTREHVCEHDAKHWTGFAAFRAELNDNDSEFSRLRELDLSSEENLSQKLFYALLDEDGYAIRHLGLLAISLSGHVTRLEARSSYYGICATIFGAATAIWSIEGKEAILHTLILGLSTFAVLVAKWNLDKRIGILRRLLGHLQFMAPNIPLRREDDFRCMAA